MWPRDEESGEAVLAVAGADTAAATLVPPSGPALTCNTIPTVRAVAGTPGDEFVTVEAYADIQGKGTVKPTVAARLTTDA